MLNLFKYITRSSSSCDDSSLPIQASQPNTNSDIMEDGYLIVGETQSERTTIYTDRFNKNVEAPPQYGEIRHSKELPSYLDYTSNVVQYSPLPTYPQGPEFNFTQDRQSDQMNLLVPGIKSAISDVPFVLSCEREILSSLQELKVKIFQQQSHFCVEKYDYDFRVELSFLKEFGGDIHFVDRYQSEK